MRLRLLTAGALAAALLTPGPAHAAGQPRLRVQVLSDRADLISGGDALVAVALPAGVDPRT
ncbi:MAG: hypothetical protein QOE86_2322, partial [Solirubrobacteraceae bacterium]|nr:hypothetical protein [Solirubrobacteraceae bacterium]